jgi:hypothetical protein
MAEIDAMQQRIERLETALAAMTSRAEIAKASLTSERERHEREFAEVAAQAERFRQCTVKAQNERNDLLSTVENLESELTAARARIVELEAEFANAERSDLGSVARAVWLARKDTKRLDWWIENSNAVLCKRNGCWAVYFGPKPFGAWCATPREALDDAISLFPIRCPSKSATAMAKTEAEV